MLIQDRGIFRPKNAHYGALLIVSITGAMKKQVSLQQLLQLEQQQLLPRLEETYKIQGLIER